MSGMTDANHNLGKINDYKDRRFIGVVMDNNDPTKNHLIKVKIPDVLDYPTEILPWCSPHSNGGGCGSEEYAQDIPLKGSKVYVTFQNGDPHHPEYSGGVRDHTTKKGVLHDNYPHRVGKDLGGGNSYYIDRNTNTVNFNHKSGTTITINDDGSVTIHNVNLATFTGPLHCNELITSDVDVIARGISLVNHLTSGVTSGNESSSTPI